MKAVLVVATVIAGIAGFTMWACGIGIFVTVVGLILKLVGVELATGFTGWVLLKFIIGWVVSLLTLGLATASLGIN